MFGPSFVKPFLIHVRCESMTVEYMRASLGHALLSVRGESMTFEYMRASLGHGLLSRF